MRWARLSPRVILEGIRTGEPRGPTLLHLSHSLAVTLFLVNGSLGLDFALGVRRVMLTIL